MPGYQIGEGCEHQAPKNDAPFEGRPTGGEKEDERRRRGGVVGDVLDAEVVAQDAVLESQHCDDGAQQHHGSGGAQPCRVCAIGSRQTQPVVGQDGSGDHGCENADQPEDRGHGVTEEGSPSL